jgi:hypothetical protein
MPRSVRIEFEESINHAMARLEANRKASREILKDLTEVLKRTSHYLPVFFRQSRGRAANGPIKNQNNA